jgi:uncharacterized protein
VPPGSRTSPITKGQCGTPARVPSRDLAVVLFALRAAILAAVALVVPACSTVPSAPADWSSWQSRRSESVGGTNGWTTVVGLHWLNEGANSAGSDPTNQVVLGSDRIPASIGVFRRKGKLLSFAAAQGTDVRCDGQPIGRIELKTDASPKPTKLQVGSISIVAIERGDRIGLRVRDPASAERRHFKGLQWFPYDPAWRLEGRFVPFAFERRLRVPDVTGSTQEFICPGSIVFKAKGSEHRLDVFQEPGEEEFFILFHDRTAGTSTYEAGRFLYVPKPGLDGRVVIDFNRAFTPPCGFTHFATCPLPPKQNWLSLAVRAGELKPTTAHH